MAAETLTGTRAGSTFPVFKPSGNGNLAVAYGSYTIPAVVEDGDIFEMCRLPAGAVVVGGMFYGDDIDTGAETLDLDVGWAANGGSGTFDTANPDGFGNLGVLTGDVLATGNLSNEVGLIYPFMGEFANGALPVFTRETVVQV